MTEEDLRLLIVSDNPLARAGLVALISDQTGFTIAGQMATQPEMLTQLDAYAPDVLVWDFGWTTNPATIAEVQAAGYPVVVLVADDTQASDAWAVGARAIVPHDIKPDVLVIVLVAVAQGMVVVDSEFQAAISPPAVVPMDLDEPLTARELEVVQHLAEGLSNRAIAHRLGISEHTVKFHVNAIMGKLHAQSRTEAAVRAMQLGLITL
jgi:DNA-binding NarL/FixJ family response regulator